MTEPRELERIVDALDRRRRHLAAALRSREELCRAYEVVSRDLFRVAIRAAEQRSAS